MSAQKLSVLLSLNKFFFNANTKFSYFFAFFMKGFRD